MLIDTIARPEFEVDAQHRIAQCCIKTRSTPVNAVVAMPDASGDSRLTYAQLSEIFENVEERLRNTRADFSNDVLRQLACRTTSYVGNALTNSRTPNRSFSIALAQDAFVAVASTAPFEGCLWNAGRAVNLRIRQPQPHAPYSLSLRTKPDNATILAVPCSSQYELAQLLNARIPFTEYEAAPTTCLEEIAKQLPAKPYLRNQLLLGFSGSQTCQPFATAFVPDESVKQFDPSCLTQQLASISQELCELKKVVSKLPKELPVDERPFDLLLKRCQELEDRTVETSVVEPLNRELILLYDLLPKPQSNEDTTVVQAVRENLVNILSLHGITPYQTPGNSFDPQTQKCIGHECTDDPTRNNSIAQRVRVGFQNPEKILRHEEVVLFRS